MKTRKTPIGTVTPGQAFQVGKLAADAVHASNLRKELVTSVLENTQSRKSLADQIVSLINDLGSLKKQNETVLPPDDLSGRETVKLPLYGLSDFYAGILTSQLDFLLSDPMEPQDESDLSDYRIAKLPKDWAIRESEDSIYLQDEKGRDRILIDKDLWETKLLSRFAVTVTHYEACSSCTGTVYDRGEPRAENENGTIIFQSGPIRYRPGFKEGSLLQKLAQYLKHPFLPSREKAGKQAVEQARIWLEESHNCDTRYWHAYWGDIRVMIAD